MTSSGKQGQEVKISPFDFSGHRFNPAAARGNAVKNCA